MTFVVFRVFFNYDFLQGAPVYLASAPQGMFMGVMAMVFYVTMLAGMFVVIHFDLWPLTTMPGIMKQPVLGRRVVPRRDRAGGRSRFRLASSAWAPTR